MCMCVCVHKSGGSFRARSRTLAVDRIDRSGRVEFVLATFAIRAAQAASQTPHCQCCLRPSLVQVLDSLSDLSWTSLASRALSRKAATPQGESSTTCRPQVMVAAGAQGTHIATQIPDAAGVMTNCVQIACGWPHVQASRPWCANSGAITCKLPKVPNRVESFAPC